MTLTTPIAWAIITFLWEAAVVGALAWVALRLSVSLRPRARYALSLAVLGSLALLPIATIARFGATPAKDQASASSTSQSIGSLSVSLSAPVANARMERAANSGAEDQSLKTLVCAWLARARGAWPEMQRRLLAVIAPIGGAIVLLWIAGAVIVTIRLMSDLTVIRRLRRAPAFPLPAALESRVATLKHSLNLPKTVTTAVSSEVEVPLVLGVFHPLVLLPPSLVSALHERHAMLLVAHELAHVERRDYAVNLAQVVFEILFFFHPVTWWLSARVREEREHCCDARALEVLGSGDSGTRTRYIAALLAAEEARTVVAPRLAPNASRGSLIRRAREILDHTPHKKPGSRLYAAISVIAATVAILLTRPQPSLALASEFRIPPTASRQPDPGSRIPPTAIWRGTVPRAGWLRVRNLVGNIVVGRTTGEETDVSSIGWRRGPSTPVSFRTTRQDDGVTVCAIRAGVECDENGNVLHIAPSELYSDSVTLVVRVPDGINVVVASNDGDLLVSGRPLSVQAQTGRGEITVRGARGSVEAATGGGKVSIGDAGGDVEVRASTGDIDATLDAGGRGRRWTFLTGSGSIRLRGQSLERAKIEVDATNGRVDSDFPFVRTSQARHGLLATTARSSVLSASTSDGDVTIKAMR